MPIKETRVLIVDDDPEVRRALVELLFHAGAAVRQAASASEAGNIFRSFMPTVLVSDIMMPGADGCDLIKELRRLPEGLSGRLFAIAMTGSTDPAIARRAFAAGFERVVVKPFRSAAMLELVFGVN